jgi:hypothetical protein
MFKIGNVINYYEKIGVTIVKITGNLTVGDKIKVYKDGDQILFQQIDKILSNQTNIPFAKPGDVVGLVLDEKIQKGSEVYRVGELGAR